MMKSIYRIIFLISADALIMTSLSQNVEATTYYVSPSGNDSNSGLSDAQAFQRLQVAADIVQAGDTVIVRKGDYNEGFVVNWNNDTRGTSNAPIQFLADPGAKIHGQNYETLDAIDIEPGTSGANYFVISGFTIDNSLGSITRAGIRVEQGVGAKILNNNVTNCGAWGIFTSHTTNLDVENNTVSNSWNQHGMYISNSAVNPIVRHNISFGNAMQGIEFNGDVTMGGSGVDTGAIVDGNIIHDNGGNGLNINGLANSVIENNVIYNNGNKGMSFYQDNGGSSTMKAASGCINNVIVNNTVLSGDWAIRLTEGATGNIIFNNILYSTGSGAISIYPDSLSGTVSNHNLVSPNFATDTNETPISWSQWTQTTGLDKNSIQMSASLANLFINANANPPDYRILSNSAAVGAGVSSLNSHSAPAQDQAGNSRNPNAEDIGAYVANAAVSTSSPSPSSPASPAPSTPPITGNSANDSSAAASGSAPTPAGGGSGCSLQTNASASGVRWSFIPFAFLALAFWQLRRNSKKNSRSIH